MRVWTVEGADTASGEDRVISIEAIDEAAARSQAKRAGILVAGIHESFIRVASDPLSRLTAAVRRATTKAPEYAEIISGGKLIRLFASIVSAVGWVAFVLGCVTLIGCILTDAPNGIPFAIGFILYALPCFVTAVILRMYAALALAVRDIARNSF